MNTGYTLQELPRWSVDSLKREGWLLVERFAKGQNAHGLHAIFSKGTKRAGIKRAQDGGYVLVEVEL